MNGGPSPSLEEMDARDGETLVAVGIPHELSSSIVSSSSLSSGFAPGSGERQVLAGRYEILALVGAGGMGTVYRARDLELDEVVALKVMRHELLDAPGLVERFRLEAKLSRRVTHKNVARVFDIGEHAGEKFLTMEFVEGESLSAELARDGAPLISRVVEVATSIAEGLRSAHAAGVVHRDLKPDNVLIGRDGRVVITDFGIARALAAGAASTMGGILGTPAYMAPEQVEARGDIDARADVYAFGALLYELCTGQRAWPGDAPFAVAAARLISAPPDPRARRPELPASLALLATSCMARSPADRPASMGVVLGELATLTVAQPARMAPIPPTLASDGGSAPKYAERMAHDGSTPRPLDGASAPKYAERAAHDGSASKTPGGSTPRPLAHDGGDPTPRPLAYAEKTVAVLPFRNAGAPDDDYLAEELTDDLLDALSMTRGLKVRARGAVQRFRGVEQDPRDIGRELGVQVVVEGSVRRARGNVRISARLVSVGDGFQLWAKRFDRPEQDVLSINDEVARAIAEALTVDARPSSAREAPSDPIALDLYIRARHEHRKFWLDHVEKAIGLFDQALAIAPDDPLVLSGLATTLARRAFFKGEEAIPRARSVAERAVAAAPHLGEAHLALGSVLFQAGEMPGAARALRIAVARSPGLAEAHASLGRLLCEIGAVDEGMRRLEAGYALDPETHVVHPELARAYALLGRWAEADVEVERLRPQTMSYWTFRARFALWRRQGDLAAAYLAEVPAGDQTMRAPRMMLEVVSQGRMSSETFEVEKLERAGGARRQAFMFQLRAELYAYISDLEQTLQSLQRSADLGLIDRFWLERCPLLDRAREDARYTEIHATVARRTDAILAAYRDV